MNSIDLNRVAAIRRRKHNQTYYRKHRVALLEQVKSYQLKHKEQYKEWLQRNPARLKKYRQTYYRKNRVKLIAQAKAYHLANKDQHLRTVKAWHQRNPDCSKASEQKRRALKLNSTTDFAKVREFLSWIKNQDFVTCTYCGKYISGKAVCIDHIVPLSRGGAHEPDNFCVSCRNCNAQKQAQLLTEWKGCPERIRKLFVFVEPTQN